jgi:CPA2 family monovalent cation:H+ antiporter-2
VEVTEDHARDHVVIVGFGRVGRHLVEVLDSLHVPIVVIESDVERIDALNQRRTPALYGDASNSEIVVHAHLERARALVITVPDDTTATLIVIAAKDLNPKLPIFVRATTEAGVRQLVRAGARRVVHPELEGGLELVHHTLLQLGFPLRQVHEYAEAVRDDQYEFTSTPTRSTGHRCRARDSLEGHRDRLDEPRRRQRAGREDVLAEADIPLRAPERRW